MKLQTAFDTLADIITDNISTIDENRLIGPYGHWFTADATSMTVGYSGVTQWKVIKEVRSDLSSRVYLNGITEEDFLNCADAFAAEFNR